MLRISKIFYIGLCHDPANALNLYQFFFGCLFRTLWIISECFTDDLRIGTSDIRDSKTVDQSCQRCLPCVFNISEQLLIRFLSKSIHALNFFLIPVQMEQIRKIFHIPMQNEFFQCRL